MARKILFLYFFCLFFSGIALCQDEIEINSQIVTVNPDKEYIIIKAGEVEGVEIGDGLIVHRNAEKLAEAQVIEVRDNVAAAEILNIEKEQKKEVVEKIVEKDKEIKEGDSILIVKKQKRRIEAGHTEQVKKETVHPEQKKSKWTTLLGSKAIARSAAPVETITSDYPVSAYAAKGESQSKAPYPERIDVIKGSSVVRANIDTDTDSVFSYSLLVLRENGYSVIFSNRGVGNILATIPIELSLMKELWADATAAIGHNLVVSLDIKDKDGSSALSIRSFKEHTQKGRQIKFPVTRDSKYYNDLVGLASRIKERAKN